jgi:hypothetical protein
MSAPLTWKWIRARDDRSGSRLGSDADSCGLADSAHAQAVEEEMNAQELLEKTRRNWITLYRWIGENLVDLRFKFRSFIVTKAAQAVKLRHPTNKTNLIIVLPPRNSSSLVCG